MAELLPPFQHTGYFTEFNKIIHCGQHTKNDKKPDSFIYKPFLQKTTCCIKEKKMPRILGKIGEVTESSLHKVGNLGLSLYFSEETCEDLEFIWEVCKMCKNKGRSCFEENCKILASTFAKTPFWQILYSK